MGSKIISVQICYGEQSSRYLWQHMKFDSDLFPPVMQLGGTDHIWTISELVEKALTGVIEQPQGRKVGRFTVVDGGKG